MRATKKQIRFCFQLQYYFWYNFDVSWLPNERLKYSFFFSRRGPLMAKGVYRLSPGHYAQHILLYPQNVLSKEYYMKHSCIVPCFSSWNIDYNTYNWLYVSSMVGYWILIFECSSHLLWWLQEYVPGTNHTTVCRSRCTNTHTTQP